MTTQLSQLPVQRFVDNNGNALAGGQLYTYQAGTSTPAATYTDSTGVTPNSNPVILNARGEANVWVSPSQVYKFVLYDSLNNLIWSVDNISDGSLNSALAVALSSTSNMSQGVALVGGAARVVASIAALRTLPKTGSPQALASGYYAQGDGGGGVYWYDATDTTSPDNGGTIIVAGDGGRWKLVHTGAVSIRQFGAKGDGTTDDTAAIQACLTAMTGYTILSPAGTFLLKTVTANALLTITNTVRVTADAGSYWVYDSSVPNTADVIVVNPAVNAVLGIEFSGLWIYQNSGSPARDVLRINLSATAGLKNLRIDRCLFRSMAGYAVNCLNPSQANQNGLFLSQITKSEFDGGVGGGGINLQGLGDSNTIADCVITGSGIGITASMLSPANPSGTSAKFAILRNNITAQGGAISIGRGRGLLIEGNNIEQTVDLTGGYCIALSTCDYDDLGVSIIRGNKIEPTDGTAHCGGISLFNCKATLIEGNQISTSSVPSSFSFAVALTGCTNVKVLDNDLYLSTNCIGVNTDSACHNTAYRRGKLDLTSGNVEFNDAGVGSKGVAKFPTYQNSWANFGSTSLVGQWTKDLGNYVHLAGTLVSGVVTANTVIFQLPAGFQPAAQENFIVYAYNTSGTWAQCDLRVDTDGSVRLRYSSAGATALSELGLSGVSFLAAEA